MFAQVPQYQVIVSTTCDEIIAPLDQLIGHSLSISLDLLNVLLELRGLCLFERHCNSGNSVLVRTTLEGWEHSEVDLAFKVVLFCAVAVLVIKYV